MAYRYGDRNQQFFLPSKIEDYVAKDAVVRAYDVIISCLDLTELGIEICPNKVGCPQYDPMTMLKLLVYGYSYGIRSSRKLERECNYNLSFIWLSGGLKPDHKTISEFRKKNKTALKAVLKQCAKLCIKLDLIDGNTLFVDGSKIRGSASIKNTWDKDKCERYLKRIDERIEEILGECETVDKDEIENASLVKMKEELKDKEALKAKVLKLTKELEEENNKTINTTDGDCARIKGLQGTQAGYNVQIVVDEKYGLLVNSDVVAENNDVAQFANQINQGNEVLGKLCNAACADSGYANTQELKKIDAQGIKVVVPSQRQASKKEASPFAKENFKYDKEKDSYICPEGQELEYRYTNKTENVKTYQIKDKDICQNCRHFDICTKSKQGRKITRLMDEEIKERLEKNYEEPDSKAIYKKRKEKAELPFGHIKRNLKMDSFLLRGKEGVRAEMSILATCFNIIRMISIMGVTTLIQRLTT
ncbi:transposase IS4 family protein [Candidatus Omnitrophus magneticus]|uniref:Transposase IS4 family protein n=1 Tax=Candidatus Omnitrophus magneticus TaxID=1609969 RepID=A0A0F0CPP8_9BACT|nr:transposase IS4 family protein [Candidatus Omnitrophus magneticus]